MSGFRAISIIALAAALIFLFTLGVAIEAPSHEFLLNFSAPKDGVTVEKPSFKEPPEIRR